MSVVALLVVLVAVSIAAGLLFRTMTEASSINDKAASIAQTGRGINTATDAVIQLNRTDEVAGSILQTATPLEGQLAEVVALAQEIDALAASINGTAAAINATAGAINNSATTINATAADINAEAVNILDVAERIDFDVQTINENLDETIAIAEAILGDTNNVLVQANNAHQNAACIDAKLLLGPEANDGHC